MDILTHEGPGATFQFLEMSQMSLYLILEEESEKNEENKRGNENDQS